MRASQNADEKIAKLKFSSVYPHYVNKVVKKGRSADDLDAVIRWLLGYSQEELELAKVDARSFSELFDKAQLPDGVPLITGVICGYRIENIENSLTQNIRRLDKIVDELSKGKALEKIIRQV
ncbi:MAG: hypothetical protein RL577_1540 [Bacteroidota bacterium]|jgi:hypothetical protein